MFIFLQKFIENIFSLLTVISFVFKNALITTCYCADNEQHYYKIKPLIRASENQYHIYFQAVVYDENYIPISTTEFTFSFSKIGLSSAFLGLSFREQMKGVLKIFQNTKGKTPHNLNQILFMATIVISGIMYINGKAMAEFLKLAKNNTNKEHLGIIDPEYEDQPFFYITFSKDDEIQVLEGINAVKCFKRNWYPCKQSQPSVNDEITISEPLVLDSGSVENICRRSTSDVAMSDVGKHISEYVKPLLNNSISRQLSNVEKETIDFYQEMFDSPLNSPTERHTTRFNLTIHSVLEVSSSFYANHWTIIGSILVCLLVILLNLYVFLSYSNPELILKKEIIENYKNKLQNHELIQELNKMRKYLLFLSMFYNFINVIVLGSFWYIFEKTVSAAV